MRKLVHASLAIALLALFARPAAAQEEEEFNKDTWPLAVNMRPLTLVGGMLEIRGDTVVVNLSDSSVGDPVLVSPHIYYGVNNKLTVGIVHQRSICVAGDACDKAYNDVTLDMLYGFMVKGSVQAAGHLGIALQSFDPFVGGLNVGVLARFGTGKVALVFDPKIYVGAIGRDEAAFVPTKEYVSVPVRIQLQVNGQTNAFVSTGIEGALENFGDNYRVPVGLGATFAVNNRLDFGAEFQFGNLGGKVFDGGPGRIDERWLYGRIALRL